MPVKHSFVKFFSSLFLRVVCSTLHILFKNVMNNYNGLNDEFVIVSFWFYHSSPISAILDLASSSCAIHLSWSTFNMAASSFLVIGGLFLI